VISGSTSGRILAIEFVADVIHTRVFDAYCKHQLEQAIPLVKPHMKI